MSIIIFLLFIYLILIAILGYGSFFRNYFFNLGNITNVGLIGFFGLFFLSGISYISHIFFPHNYLHNSIVLVFGLILFWINFYNKIFFPKINYLLFLLLILGIFLAKTHDDFPYYHLPNALHFSENKLEFGLGHLNHGFKQPSSIFYLYSLFNLPFIKFYAFNFINFLFLIFAVFYFSENLIKKIKLKKFDLDEILKLFFLIVIISIFNRIGAYGTDITGQILSLILFCIFFELLKKDNLKNINLEKLLIFISILSYLITIKTYFVIYSILPITFFLLFSNKILLLKKILYSKVFVFSSVVIFMMIVTNITSTGCIIYPISSLCFPKFFFWGLDIEIVQYLSNWYEIWSKAGAGPDFREIEPEKYIEGFNWLNNWIDRYFFNKVSDFLISILVCIIIFSIIFRDSFKIRKYQKRVKISLVVIFLLLIIWFLNFPTLRYGGYSLLIIFIALHFINFIDLKKSNFSSLKKKAIILFVLASTVFVSKNSTRIYKEFNYQPVENFKSFPFYYVKNVEYEKNFIDGEIVFKVDGMCWATPSPCVRNLNLKIENYLNYKVYLKK